MAASLAALRFARRRPNCSRIALPRSPEVAQTRRDVRGKGSLYASSPLSRLLCGGAIAVAPERHFLCSTAAFFLQPSVEKAARVFEAPSLERAAADSGSDETLVLLTNSCRLLLLPTFFFFRNRCLPVSYFSIVAVVIREMRTARVVASGDIATSVSVRGVGSS